MDIHTSITTVYKAHGMSQAPCSSLVFFNIPTTLGGGIVVTYALQMKKLKLREIVSASISHLHNSSGEVWFYVIRNTLILMTYI